MAIQFLRGNASTLNSSQQVFLPGQPIFEQDTGKLKIGDGSHVYSALSYIGDSESTSFVPTLVSNDGHSQHYIDLAKNLRLAFGYTEIGNLNIGRLASSWTTTPINEAATTMYLRASGCSGFTLKYKVFGFKDLEADDYELLGIQMGLATFGNGGTNYAASLATLNYLVPKRGIQYNIWGDLDNLNENDFINYIVLAELLNV